MTARRPERLWSIERHVADAAALHDRELPEPAAPRVWWLEPTEPAVVLGSAQRDQVSRGPSVAGIAVVRRHSGGGAVLVVPGDVLWVDVLVPKQDSLWSEDIGRATWWLGAVWAGGSDGPPGTSVLLP